MRLRNSRPFRSRKFRSYLSFALVVLFCAAATILTVVVTATTPTPGSGTVTPANTPNNPLTYTGGPFTVANPTGLVGLQCTAQLPCDDFDLTVDAPDGMLDTHEIRIRFAWSNPEADYDVVVYKGSRIFAQAGASSIPGYVGLPAVAAAFKSRVVAFNPLGTSYTASGTFHEKVTHHTAGT